MKSLIVFCAAVSFVLFQSPAQAVYVPGQAKPILQSKMFASESEGLVNQGESLLLVYYQGDKFNSQQSDYLELTWQGEVLLIPVLESEKGECGQTHILAANEALFELMPYSTSESNEAQAYLELIDYSESNCVRPQSLGWEAMIYLKDSVGQFLGRGLFEGNPEPVVTIM